MPVSYTIDHERKRIYARATGVVTFDELLAHMRAEAGTPAASYPEIFDCTDSTTNIDSADVRVLVGHRKRIAEVQEPAAAAIVATNDLFFGMFRVFDTLTDEVRPIRVFRSVDEAGKWLDSLEQETGADDGAS
jgi:hypothetical protein